MNRTRGCENYDSIKSISVDTCCPSIFSPISKKTVKTCRKECRSKGFCCFAECHLKGSQMSDDSGKFDTSKTKEHLKSLAKESNYVRKKINFSRALTIFST